MSGIINKTRRVILKIKSFVKNFAPPAGGLNK
jgi:hypothetical protein